LKPQAKEEAMLTRRRFLSHAAKGSSLLALNSMFMGSGAFATEEAAESHRLLILDNGRKRWPAEQHQLLLVDVESGKIVARQEIGSNTSLTVSPKGDLVAAIYNRWHERILPPTHLDFCRGSDLKRLESGLLPAITRMNYKLGAASDSWLSPEGQALIVQGPEYRGTNAHMATTVLNCVKRELDKARFFKLSEKPVRIPRAHGVDIVSVADWPRVHVWNRNLSLLYGVDFSTGEILSKLLISDDPALEKTDPAELEKIDADRLLRLKHHGWMLATGGRFACYVPMSWAPPGRVRKIDLSADPPKVVRTWKEPQPDLAAGIVAVSEKAGRIFVLEHEPPRAGRPMPSNHVKVLSADDLTVKQEIKLLLEDCNGLASSRDGKYLYAWHTEAAKVAVMDTATGRQVKVLENLAKNPDIVIALSQGKVEK
jgi:hypothetical protein